MRLDPAPHDTAPSPLYDAVTGLPNRDLFLDRLTMALHGGERTGDATAVVLVRVDSADIALDGPPVADIEPVLQGIAERLLGAVRSFDSVGRLDTRTFAILFQGRMDEEMLRILARRVLFELSPPVQLRLRQYFIMARLGGTTAEPGFDNPEALMERAADALLEAERPESELFVFHDIDNAAVPHPS
ncbi:hypothetical protein ASE01_16010 [Nocardioides sp. Root190]|uniref:diguanylate cyclase domain-containing protein n=1 Tax=Nocardioides sp. Root190 TaxID=1736488 RepID=UPI0007011B35|nr:diguanylate cyclase [Nocardioides sp. Root190]KRB76463.1 hypothetical protein ASE01_16010 [Nocardioides sp. Root190]